MRIVFLLSGNKGRNGDVDGDTIRNGGVGASGTDQSTIMVAEYLASQGKHEVVIATETNTATKVVRGVTYTNIAMKELTDAERTFDVLVTMLWFSDFESLPIKVTRGVIIVQHMQYVYSSGEIKSFLSKRPGLKVGVVHVSKWESALTAAQFTNIFPGCRQMVIYNPIMTDIIQQVLNEGHARKNHALVFTAAWNRGAEMCKVLFQDYLKEDRWVDKELYTSDYTRCTLSFHADPRIHELGSQDKVSLLRTLAKCSYFVYPCVNAGPGALHHDTFGCVVAEALAMGVRVICYPMGALPEVYGNLLTYVPFPEGVNEGAVQAGRVGDEPRLFDPERFANVLRNADMEPYDRNVGRESVVSRFSIDVIGNEWLKFINDLF